VLSLFGDAVSASHVPFQSDHKVMAHNGMDPQDAHMATGLFESLQLNAVPMDPR
jgi:hypothetical protein